MRFLKKRNIGVASIITSGVLAFTGCSTVKQGESITENKQGVSASLDYTIECPSNIKEDDVNCTTEFESSDVIESSECLEENIEYQIDDTPSTVVGSHEYINHVDEVVDDPVPFAYSGQNEYMNHDDIEVPFAYAGKYEYMNNVDLEQKDDVMIGKVVYASGFKGASSNFLFLDDSSYGLGYNVVTYFKDDGMGNYTPQILCICAKSIDVIDGIPVIYFRNDQDVCDIISSYGLSSDSLGLYSNNVCDYPVNVDENGNEFITYDGMKINNEYVKVK